MPRLPKDWPDRKLKFATRPGKRKKLRRKHDRICICCGAKFKGWWNSWYINDNHRYKAQWKGYTAPYPTKAQPEGATLKELRALCHQPARVLHKKMSSEEKQALRDKWGIKTYKPLSPFQPTYNHSENPCKPIAVAIHQDDFWLGQSESGYCLHIVDQAYQLDQKDLKTLAALMYIGLGLAYDLRELKLLSTSLRQKARGYSKVFLSLLEGRAGV